MSEFLKIAIINNSGNVGKSTVCDILLKPRIPDLEVIKIETINYDNSDDVKISAKDIQEVFEKMDSVDKAIIDIGSSNIETFMKNMTKLEGSHEDIDFFIIPTTPIQKQQVDTIVTVQSLLDIGVDISQIKIIFNFFDNSKSIEKQYIQIFESELFQMLNLKDHNKIFTISENEVFDLAAQMEISFQDVLEDQRDFKNLIRNSKDIEERKILSLKRLTSRLAVGFNKELDLTFEKLMTDCQL